MEVKITNHSEEELIERLRMVNMLQSPDVFPYKNAFISLERIATDYLYPTQFYVSRKELEKIRNVHFGLQELGWDMFNLGGYLSLDFGDKIIDLLPIIVEESIEKSGRVIPLINDGQHRAYLARSSWVIPQVVYIRGLPKETPYYAFPLANQWNDVSIIEEEREAPLKKNHRIKENKKLYRCFTQQFSNESKPRGIITG